MRVTVEETQDGTENKRKAVVECEEDNTPLAETLDMIFRGLLAFGYTEDAIGQTLHAYTTRPEEDTPPPEEDKSELQEM